MKYILQVDYDILGVASADSTPINGVIVTRYLEADPKEILKRVMDEVVKIEAELDCKTELSELELVGVEEYGDVEPGKIYY